MTEKVNFLFIAVCSFPADAKQQVVLNLNLTYTLLQSMKIIMQMWGLLVRGQCFSGLV